jgi:hypothetical protein
VSATVYVCVFVQSEVCMYGEYVFICVVRVCVRLCVRMSVCLYVTLQNWSGSGAW